jgi:hypothetical protein
MQKNVNKSKLLQPSSLRTLSNYVKGRTCIVSKAQPNGSVSCHHYSDKPDYLDNNNRVSLIT